MQLHQQEENDVRTLLQIVQTFYSVPGVLGVLERRGNVMRAWLQLVMGEASGQLLTLRAGSRPSGTWGRCTGSSRTTGPGTLLHAALTVSSPIPHRSNTLDSQTTTNTNTYDCVCTALHFAHSLARYADPCLTKLFNQYECILTQEERVASPSGVGGPFIRFSFLLGKDTLALVVQFSEAGVGVAGKNVSTSQGRAPIRCRNRIWSRRTVDTRCSGALLRAATTLSKSYLGTVRPSTTALSSALRQCSSPHYAMALQIVTAALYGGFRRRSPLRYVCCLCPLPALSCALPVTLSFAALALTSHFPGVHLCTLPTITSALRRDSPLCYAVALFPISSALSSSLRRHSPSPFPGHLL